MTDSRPEALRKAIAEYRRKHHPHLIGSPDTMQVGDLVVVRPDADANEEGDWFTPTMNAVWWVGEMQPDAHSFPYINAKLCTNAVEMACEADWITDAGPYRLVVQGELYGTISVEQVYGVIAHAGPHTDHMRDLKGHDEHGAGFMPLAGPVDPRWHFKEEELRRHNNYVLATRRRLFAEIWPDGDQ